MTTVFNTFFFIVNLKVYYSKLEKDVHLECPFTSQISKGYPSISYTSKSQLTKPSVFPVMLELQKSCRIFSNSKTKFIKKARGK